MGDAKEVKLPKIQSPFGIIRKYIMNNKSTFSILAA
jgi:hypothetical protein